MIKGNNILTIGCDFDPPKGGIAQVLYTYSKEVYEQFNFIPNSCEGNKWKKLLIAIKAFIQCLWVFTFRKEITIIHIHTASYVSFRRSAIFVRLAKMYGKKVVLHIHGGGFKDYYQTTPIWIKSILDKCDEIVALTSEWKSFFQEIGYNNVFIVNNIIPRPKMKSVTKDGRIHLLFLGWIVKEKGIFDLIEVFAGHKKECEDKIVLHIGGNHEIEKLLEMIKSFHLEKNVKYEGWVSGEKKIQLLNMMDAFILPSYTEGLPISILESLSYGKPVITTSVGGIPEVVNHKNGYLFNAGDKNAMWNIIKSIIHYPNQLTDKADAARLSIMENLPDHIVKQLQRMYEGLC